MKSSVYIALSMAASFLAASFIPALIMALFHAPLGREQFAATLLFGMGIGLSAADLVRQFAHAKSR